MSLDPGAPAARTPLDPGICYRALRTRDARFDGRFFVAVRSTGIYCRPVCPARTPRRENCLFLPCAAAAESAGFRPCRRCRPESAPGTPAWAGTSATVSRGLRLIAEGALDGPGGVPELAGRLGIGERHLRRLFVEHLGAAPLAIAQTRRAHFAAQLLRETDWPVQRVAEAAGFRSLRRFHEAVRAAFGCAPRDLRARRRPDADAAAIRLAWRPPFAADALLGYLASRRVPGVESLRGSTLRRSLRVDGRLLVVEVDLAADPRAIAVRVHGAEPADWLAVAERVRAVFDLGADPGAIAAQLGADPLLRPRLERLPGVRVVGAWDPFETAVRVVLHQQISVPAATRLSGRVAERFGTRLPDALRGADDGGPTHAFPDAAALADAPLETIGLTRARAAALRGLAAAVVDGRLDLGPGADPDAARDALLALPGIGPWTAELVRMRALREPDAFPAGDLGLRRALGCSAAELERRAERWRPWRAYAATLLWLVPGAAATRGSAAARAATARRSHRAAPDRS